MKMKNSILQTINRYELLKKDMEIIVGLSGGPDSMCLFDVLHELSPRMNWKLRVVHVNHQLRPGAADSDQQFVEDLCRRLNVPCRVFTEDCTELAAKENLTSEEAGRLVRYRAFGQVASEIEQSGVPKEKIAIALAHNAEDQCETILFRIMRGTGTDGLAGIAYKRLDENGFAIVRPLLDTTRADIEKYCMERNLSPRIDNTNCENIYMRNKIRNMLVPFIKENFNENIVETVNRLGRAAAEDRDFIRTAGKQAFDSALLKEDADKMAFSIKNLQELHKAVRIRTYTIALAGIGMKTNLTSRHVEAIESLLYSQSPSAAADLSGDYRVRRSYEAIVFERYRSEKKDGEQWLSKGVPGWKVQAMGFGEYMEYRSEAALRGSIYGAFTGVDIDSLCFRRRGPGDVIRFNGGTKKLQDFFVDEKVPKADRDQIRVLAKGREILWILPSEVFANKTLKKKGRFSAAYKPERSRQETIIVLEKL